MARRIVLFGASGYTGRLVAEALARAKARPVLVGRSHQNLAALGVSLGKGLDIAVADVAHPATLLEVLRPHDVLVSTVGPFARFGRPVVEAAIIRRCTYLDSTGEPPFIRSVIEELGPVAETAGVTLLPAAAFDYTAGALAAEIALRPVGDAASRVDIGYFFLGGRRGALSRGTVASLGGFAFTAQPTFRKGELVAGRLGDRVATFEVGSTRRPALSVGGAEHYWLPRRHPSLRDVNVFVGAESREATARLAGRLVAAGSVIPGVPSLVRLVSRRPRSVAGPSAEQREHSGAEVQAVVYDGSGTPCRMVVLRGANPYSFSGALLAWEAMRLAASGDTPAGAQSPLDVFGLEELRDAAAEAGLPVAEET
ncbi:MAG: saccharopine dehydrogenase NADP-binding domain-containing protein [Candidatus Dormibacteraeota bacterium]|nr:saccharopine dehydrogenase NADP-binding domain-containing protein [Candidatus Dormibacteraeota bacterium]